MLSIALKRDIIPRTMQNEIDSLKNEISELKQLVQENHQLLVGIYQRARITMFFNVVKWVIIVGISVGAFYYIQPFFETIMATYSNITGLGGMGGVSDQQNILEILNNFK